MIREYLHSESFHVRLFRILVVFSIPYWFAAVAKGLIFESPVSVVVLDACNFIVPIVLFLLDRRGVGFRRLALMYAIAWTILLFFYLIYMGGIDGPYTYVFFPLMMFTVVLLENPAKILVVFCQVAVVSVVAMGWLEGYIVIQDNYSVTPVILDYLLSIGLFALIVGYVKRNYDRSRYDLMKRNAQMREVNEQLEVKRKQLIDQKNLIVSIQNNLEVLIKDRTQEQELRHKQLEEYAYDNAHIVRGPLTNIMGLVDILESEEYSKKELEIVKKSAQDLDAQIKRINQILK